MVANNMAQLDAMLIKEMQKALRVVADKALADMYEETADFYTGGEPIPAEEGGYVRTGALGDTPRTTAVETNGKSASFTAYLDTNHIYTTGKNPPMLDVLNLANDGVNDSSVGWLRDVVGKEGFWDRAEDKIKEDFESTFFQFFNLRY